MTEWEPALLSAPRPAAAGRRRWTSDLLSLAYRKPRTIYNASTRFLINY